MKAEYLRIGNYVYDGKEAIAIDIISLRYMVDNKGIEIFKPIPLLDEWLDKLGFKKEFDGCYSTEKTAFPIWRNIHNNVVGLKWNEFYAGTGGVIKSVVHLKHVHQLQNLYFALTGKELVIKDGI